MKRTIAIAALILLTLASGASEEDSVEKLDSARRNTVKYGTDAEIVSLIAALESEKVDSLDRDLIGLVETASGTKIVDSIFSYLANGRKAGAESRAVRILENRDREANSNVDSAIRYLASVKHRAAAPLLRGILDAEEERFSPAAARALGYCGDEDDAEFLVAYRQDRDPPEAVSGEIIFALGELKSEKASEFLIDLLSNPETKPSRKIAAVESLGKIGTKDAQDPLLDALRDQDANVRAAALSAVAAFSGKKIETAIVESFRDSFYKVRLAAAKAAGEKKLEEAIPFLKYRAERDDVAAVKEESVRALGSIGSEEAVEILSGFFVDKKTPERIRVAAAKAVLEKDSRKHARTVIEAMNQAKADKKTSLYNSLAKAVSTTKSTEFEEQAKLFLSSPDIVDRHYGLDLVILNGYTSLKAQIEPLAKDANASIARKAKKALGE